MATKRRITTGVERAFFAILKDENGTVPTYGAVKYLQGLQEFSIVANEETASIYAENRTWETENALGEVEVTLTFASLFTEDYALLLGKKMADGGGLIESSNDEAPYIALMLEKTLSGGVKEYLTLYKGRLRIPEDVARTKEGATEFQVKSLSGTFMALNNNIWKHVVKSDDVNFVQTAHDVHWGKTVELPSITVRNGGDPTLAPTGGQTLAGATQREIKVTFKDAIASYNVSVVNVANSTPVEISESLDDTKKILTITLPAQIPTPGAHRLSIIGATDVFGEVLKDLSYTYTINNA